MATILSLAKTGTTLLVNQSIQQKENRAPAAAIRTVAHNLRAMHKYVATNASSVGLRLRQMTLNFNQSLFYLLRFVHIFSIKAVLRLKVFIQLANCARDMPIVTRDKLQLRFL